MRHRVILAGCGHMAGGWIGALSSDRMAGRAELVGLVDPVPGAANAFRLRHGLGEVACFLDIAEAIAALKPDVVFDVAVPSARARIVQAALAAGAHVLTEKPMAQTLDEARAINRAVAGTGLVHAVTQNRRFKPGLRRAKAVVDSGVLGQITTLNCDFFIGAHFGGFRDEMANVLLLDMAIHTFDAARCISGQEAQAVYCHETNPQGSWYRHGAAANAIFEMSGGVVFNYRGSWCAEGANTNWDSSWRIIGTKGTLLWDGEDGFELNLVDGDEGFFRPLRSAEVPPPPEPDKTLEHLSVMVGFFDAIDAGTVPETAGADNIRSLAMVFGAIESAASRQRIEIQA